MKLITSSVLMVWDWKSYILNSNIFITKLNSAPPISSPPNCQTAKFKHDRLIGQLGDYKLFLNFISSL